MTRSLYQGKEYKYIEVALSAHVNVVPMGEGLSQYDALGPSFLLDLATTFQDGAKYGAYRMYMTCPLYPIVKNVQ